MSEDTGFHENTLAGIEWAAAMALDMSAGAPCGRWEAEVCADSSASLGKYAVRFRRSLEHFGEFPKNGAEFVRQALEGLPWFARSLVALVAEARRLREREATLTAERDEARAWVRRITAAERVLTCVYCGEAYPPGTPNHGADVLTAHVRVCAKHPLREAEAEIARLRERERERDDWGRVQCREPGTVPVAKDGSP